MFKLAMIQMLVEGGEKEKNLARAEARLAEAAREGANVALLPEALDLGWTHLSSLTEAEPIPHGEPFKRLADAAKKHGLYVCAGLTELAANESPNAVYNAAVLIGPDGNLLVKHRKINELEIGHPYYAQGQKLEVVTTPVGCIGVMICADAFARGQVAIRSLALMGADVLLSPCAWAVRADHDNALEPYGQIWRDSYQPVARDFSVWIAGVSNVGPITGGPWEGRKCIGCSLAVDASGNIAAQGPYGETAETMIMLDIEPVPRPARGDGWGRGPH